MWWLKLVKMFIVFKMIRRSWCATDCLLCSTQWQNSTPKCRVISFHCGERGEKGR